MSIKICIYADGWGSGGIEKNFVEIFSVLCKKRAGKYKFFVASPAHFDTLLDSTLADFGIKMIFAYDMTNGNQEKVSLKNRLVFIKKICMAERPDIVHINISTGLAFLYAHIIKKSLPDCKIIVHAHGDGIEPPHRLIKNVVYRACRFFWEREADRYIACSKQISEWMYSKHVKDFPTCQVIHNSIDTKKFEFNAEARKYYRDKIGGGTELIIGTIGRICYQKNPDFILEIINELKNRKVQFKFLWVGQGEEKENIKKRAEQTGVLDRIVFYGVTNDVSGILSAMDVFILPSRYEGLGIVLIEAQSNGLPCITSLNIPEEAQVSNNYCKLPIINATLWCDKIMLFSENKDRKYPEASILNAGYLLNNTVRDVERLYSD